MEKDTIKEWIKEYIEKNIHITVDDTISLLDPRNGLQPRDLLKLYFAIENRFEIEFDEQNIIDERFDYMCNMIEAIHAKIIV